MQWQELEQHLIDAAQQQGLRVQRRRIPISGAGFGDWCVYSSGQVINLSELAQQLLQALSPEKL